MVQGETDRTLRRHFATSCELLMKEDLHDIRARKEYEAIRAFMST